MPALTARRFVAWSFRAACAGLACTGGSEPEPAPSLFGRVVFSRETPDTSFAIYLMTPEGTDIRLLKWVEGRALIIPRVSPDGQQIAVLTFPTGPLGGTQEPYIMNADGSDFRPLPNAFGGGPASWAPDGSRLAFACVDPFPPVGESSKAICEINVDGSGLRRVNHSAFISLSPAWSPDGLRIAYMSDSTGSALDIFTMSSAGSDVQQVTATPWQESGPAWSPDGALLAFWRSGIGYGPSQVLVIEPSGAGELPVGAPAAASFGPSWSPAGTEIWFSAGEQLFAVGPDGTGLHQVTTSSRAAAWPSFGPEAVAR